MTHINVLGIKLESTKIEKLMLRTPIVRVQIIKVRNSLEKCE